MTEPKKADHKQKFDEHYFKSDTYENVSFEKYSQYWWSNRFYAILARRYGEAGSRLLEIGTGLGHLAGQLEDGFETYAMDINLWALLQAKANVVSTPLSLASAEELPYADDSFGVVIIKHVVEHLEKYEQAICELARVMAPGGVLILAVPNLGSLLRPLKGDRWIGYQDPTHISLQTPEEWLRLIGPVAGLELLRVASDGFWDVPYIPVLPAGLQKLIFGSLGGFQAITGWLFLPLRWGESMIVIARKVGA
jgi:2-polyprenyl-3-methyl-5-hydroxy-6-metoxy-1,4-benzoquinol methylase